MFKKSLPPSIMTWCQHKSLPQGEPNFRHLLHFSRLLLYCFFLAHFIVHTAEYGHHVVAPKTTNSVEKHIIIASQ